MAQEFVYSETTRDKAVQYLKGKIDKYKADLKFATQIQLELESLSSNFDTLTLNEIFSEYQPFSEKEELTDERLDQDLEICKKCREECKHLFQQGKITYERCKKIYTQIDFFHNKLWRVRHGPDSIKDYPNLRIFRDMLNEAQKDKIIQSIFNRHNINVETIDGLSSIIRKTKKHIILYEKEIKYILHIPVYPEEDAIKFNSLNIDPEDKDDYYGLIESLREQYERYALNNNLCSEYFTIVQLIEEYYILKKEPHPEIRKYRQFEYNGSLKNMVHDILMKILDDPEMNSERKVLQQLVDRFISPQEYLIQECNKHYIDWLDQNGTIGLECPAHKGCIITNRQEKCNYKLPMRIQLNKDSSVYQQKLKPDVFTLNSDITELKSCYKIVM